MSAVNTAWGPPGYDQVFGAQNANSIGQDVGTALTGSVLTAANTALLQKARDRYSTIMNPQQSRTIYNATIRVERADNGFIVMLDDSRCARIKVAASLDEVRDLIMAEMAIAQLERK